MATTRTATGLLLCLSMLVTGCGVKMATGAASGGSFVSPVMTRALARNELRVGTSGDQPPLTATTKAGQIIGLDADLAGAIANAMGVPVKLTPMQFSELLPALERGDVDMVLSGVTMTPKRNLTVAFVGPYFVSGKALLTRSKRIAGVKDSQELDRPEVTLVALRGSTSQMFAQEAMPRAKLALTNDYAEGVKAVVDRTADALVADFTFCIVSVLRNPDAGLETLVAPLTFEPLGIAVPADDPLLVNWMENFLLTLEGTGEMDALRAKWLQNGAWISELP